MNKQQLIKKAVHFGITTLCSRMLGFAREIIRAQYLGVGIASDAFLTAFRLPQSLYKIFAEGPISAALIPLSIKLYKHEGAHSVEQLITLALMCLQGFFLILCGIITLFPKFFLWVLVPGWFIKTGEHTLIIEKTASMMPVLMGTIFFTSSAAFLTGALQIRSIFLPTAMQPIIMNVLLISEFLWCIYAQVPVEQFVMLYFVNGCIIFIFSLLSFMKNTKFAWPFTQKTYGHAFQLSKKLIPCFINLGLLEINTFIDTQFASFFAQGTISLFNYSGAFIRLPLGIFATAFATISLPHFSRISNYAPKRLGFHILESTKLILWLTVPVVLCMIYFSFEIFYTLLPGFTRGDALIASHLLTAAALGLFFFSLNRILLNVYYALHETILPTVISAIIVGINIGLNYTLMQPLGVIGIMLATSIAGIIQTALLLYFLKTRFYINFFGWKMVNFAAHYSLQLITIIPVFYVLYKIIYNQLHLLPFLVASWGLWLWVMPLAFVMFCVLWITRPYFGLKIYYFS